MKLTVHLNLPHRGEIVQNYFQLRYITVVMGENEITVGVIRIKEVSDLFNTAEVLDSKYLPRGSKLAIVTNAGGFGVLATDTLIDLAGT
jgi:hypothetical protein